MGKIKFSRKLTEVGNGKAYNIIRCYLEWKKNWNFEVFLLMMKAYNIINYIITVS